MVCHIRSVIFPSSGYETQKTSIRIAWEQSRPDAHTFHFSVDRDGVGRKGRFITIRSLPVSCSQDLGGGIIVS
jgi:hypothetical protein